jgi:hypothetical protein
MMMKNIYKLNITINMLRIFVNGVLAAESEGGREPGTDTTIYLLQDSGKGQVNY